MAKHLTAAQIVTITAEAAEQYANGWTIRRIAAHHNISYTTAHRLLAEGGVTMRHRGGAPNRASQ